MTELQLTEHTRAEIVRRAGGIHRLKSTRRRMNPDAAKALRESGISEKDITILLEGSEHDRSYVADVAAAARLHTEIPEPIDRALRRFSEAVDSTATSTALAMPSMSGWRAESDNVHVHDKHGTVRLHDGGTRWTHHAVGGRIVKSGTTQESLASHLRGLVGDTGNSGAADANAEALDDVRAFARSRMLGEPRRGTMAPATIKLVEGVRARLVGGSVPVTGEDLHAKMRSKLVS